MTSAALTSRRWWTLAVLSIVVLGVGGTVWFWLADANRPAPDDEPRSDPPPPDPRLVFKTPYRNVRPEVKYVGDATCATCHAEISRTYHAHPMGRSAEWVGRGASAEAHVAGANNPVTAGGFTLRVEQRDGRVFHTMSALNLPGEAIPPYSVSVELAIGSGRQGKSYLTIDQGAVWQSPLSWYHQGKRWDVSPRFELGAKSRRPVGAACLLCHTDTVKPVPQSLNRYHEPLFQFQPSIGCERCHGPGELHVAERSAGPASAIPDYSIVNPAHLPADLKADICRQCHLQGESRVDRRGRNVTEYRPGLPWEQFVSVFISHPKRTDSRKSVGQFEQMEMSRCYLGSGGRMSCTSCHDPHLAPEHEAAASHYRTRCLTCHKQHGCSAPEADRRAKEDSCIACHMPARDSSNIVHAAVTDHRIPRRPEVPPPVVNQHLSTDSSPFVASPPGPHAPSVEERERDWAVVFAHEVTKPAPSESISPEMLQLAKKRLDAALTRWPGDDVCWSALAGVHLAQKETEQALRAARRAVALAPESESALGRLAETAGAAREYELMADTGRRLVSLNPSSADNRVVLATALVCLKRWDRGKAEVQAALRIHPLHPNARLILGVCLDRLGDSRAGRTQLELGMRLAPSPKLRATMSEWYLQQIR